LLEYDGGGVGGGVGEVDMAGWEELGDHFGGIMRLSQRLRGREGVAVIYLCDCQRLGSSCLYLLRGA
jgi:hypothetical protein